MKKATTMIEENGKKALGILLAIALVLMVPIALPRQAQAAPFSDVSAGEWYAPFVSYVSEKGIIKGYSDTTLFGPDDTITRAQVVTVLWRAGSGEAEGEYAMNTSGFVDVADKQYYTAAMNWARAKGVMNGDAQTHTLVRPDDSISREEIATVVSNYASCIARLDIDTAGMAWPQGTLDIERVSDWAYPSLMWTANNKIMGGINNGNSTQSLCPQAEATRAQFAKIITSLVRDVIPSKPGNPGEPGVADKRYETPASVAVADVYEDRARVVVYNKHSTDITSVCEFSLDGGTTWTTNPALGGLSAQTAYRVAARQAAGSGYLASSPAYASFTTTAHQQTGSQKIWVDEYDLLAPTVAKNLDLEREGKPCVYSSGIVNATQHGVVESEGDYTESERAVQAFRAAYDTSMRDISADCVYNDDWDRYGHEARIGTWSLAPTGGHWEVGNNQAEIDTIRSRVGSEMTTVGYTSTDAWVFKTSDGVKFTSKKDAWKHWQDTGYRIVFADCTWPTSGNMNTPIGKQSTIEMVTAAGGNPNNAWCETGQTLVRRA
ncbi:MAG: S-layer homology domain-containing protein [Raoultibacter sp.]